MAEAAVFADETVYARMHTEQACCNAQYEIRRPLGNCGVPYDLLLTSDFSTCYQKYKAIIFPAPISCPAQEEAHRLCDAAGIPYLQATEDHFSFSPDELRDFFVRAGVWCYCKSNDVCYAGRGFLALHASEAGKKELLLPRPHRVTPLLPPGEPVMTDRIEMTLEQFETRLFSVE